MLMTVFCTVLSVLQFNYNRLARKIQDFLRKFMKERGDFSENISKFGRLSKKIRRNRCIFGGEERKITLNLLTIKRE